MTLVALHPTPTQLSFVAPPAPRVQVSVCAPMAGISMGDTDTAYLYARSA